ncbi:protein FAR1-RELATED SEQUENCE 5-like [Apium graveolens]|uniref:protein FAR1-RELATED SEQUENCE 5-like n=1 Tax=Apium graveolens TaxID=4045 RepID=UPI003D7BF4B3
MSFVPFTGVNHHYQSVIFGFALMRDEHALTFEWILRTWLEGVGNKPPMTIITDQDQVMASVITDVLPNTTHLLCSWQISQKFSEKLAHYYSAFPEFKTDFNYCIYKSLIKDFFEARWGSFVEMYHLQEHKWLNGLYELKRKWIIAYTINTFSAFQNSTSRSEGMNFSYDKYVSSETGLNEFIENAQKELGRQFMRENEEDYVTINLKRPMKMHTTLEYHASCIYTKEMFRRFQDELVEFSKYFVEKNRRACEEGERMGDVYTYYSFYRPMSEPMRRNIYFVVFEKTSFLGMCMCRMFEHSGLPCRHLLTFFTKKRVSEIPPYFINSRWTMHANRVDGVLPYDLDVGQSHEMTSTDRFNRMTMLTMSFSQSSIASKERYDYDVGVMNREILILERMSVDGIKSYRSNSHAPNASAHEEPILDLIITQTKGRKKDVRFKSPMESIGKRVSLQESVPIVKGKAMIKESVLVDLKILKMLKNCNIISSVVFVTECYNLLMNLNI